MAGATQVGRPVARAAPPPRAPARRRERCPGCGALAERRQLVCLGCGERLALEPKRTGRPVLAAASALVAVALTCAVLVGQVIIGADEPPATGAERGAPERAGAIAGAAPERRSAAPQPAAAQLRRAEVRLRTAAARARRQVAAAAAGWPAAQAGWTVVVLAAADGASAERYAAQLGAAGVDAGVISPEQRPDLGSLWLVFSGVHADQAAASAAAAELRGGYPSAYVRFVPRAPTSAAAAPPPQG